MTLKGTSPACVPDPAVIGQSEPNLGWREQVVIDKQPIEFPEGVRERVRRYAAREKSVQEARLSNLKNQLYILGRQIEQKKSRKP